MSDKLYWERLHPDALSPIQIHEGDAGYDLCSIEALGVPQNQRALVHTGLAVAIPQGYVGLIRDRSSVARDVGLAVLGGVIDSNYRGEIMILMYNTSPHWQGINFKQRIAQLVIVPYFSGGVQLVDSLPKFLYGKDSKERDGGFGSSGVY